MRDESADGYIEARAAELQASAQGPQFSPESGLRPPKVAPVRVPGAAGTVPRARGGC